MLIGCGHGMPAASATDGQFEVDRLPVLERRPAFTTQGNGRPMKDFRRVALAEGEQGLFV